MDLTITQVNKNHLFMTLAGVAVSVLCLVYALRGTNMDDIVQSLSGASLWMAMPLLIAYGCHYWVKAIRWRLLLKPIKTTTSGEIFAPMMMGFFGNNILPAHLGEFVRMYLGARRLGLSQAEVLATLVLERLFDVLVILLFVGILLTMESRLPEQLVAVGWLLCGAVAVVMAVLAGFIRWTEHGLALMRRMLFFLPVHFQNKLVEHIRLAVGGLSSLAQPSLWLGIIGTSVVQWVFMGLAIHWAMLAVGITTGFASSLLVLCCVVFAVILPSAPGFFGVMQIAFLIALKPYGIPEGEAVVASGYFQVITFTAVTGLGFILMHSMGYTLRQLKKESHT